jgi:pimeloyl-ACP methyl ester carboxylesterase
VVVLLALSGAAIFYLHPLWVADQQLHFKLWREGVRSHSVDLPSGRIHYYEAGAGTPLLLIHGLGGRAEDWAELMPGLAANGFHVYAPDLLGYGRSARPDLDYSIALEERVMLEWMQAMHLDHADVGGWSMGGWVAMQLTLDHPELVDKLVVYDAAGVRFVPDFTQDLFTPSDAEDVDALLAKLFVGQRKLPPFVMRDLLRTMAKNKRVVGRSIAEMMSGRELLDDRLGQMRRPMLIVWGEEDRLLPLKTVGVRIHQLTPGSVLETVTGCGHMAPEQCAAPVLKDTVDFLLGK